MKDFLKMLGFFIQVLIVTLILTACFAGLYRLMHVGDPHYKNDRERLSQDAGAWGIMMTGLSFLAFAVLIVLSLIFHAEFNLFMMEYPEMVTFAFLSIIGVLALGLVSSLVMMFND